MTSHTINLSLLLLLLVSCASPSAPVSASPRVKLFVSSDGLYRVTFASLRDAGAPMDQIDPATFQLYRGDREVAIRVTGETASPAGKENLAIEFFGAASDSPYSASSVYWLTWGAQSGKRMREISAPPSGAPKDATQDTARASKPTLYVLEAGTTGNHWFWQSLTAPMTTTITITLPAALPVSAQLRANLWGRTQDPIAPDHHLTAFVNNARAADDKWDGQGAHSITATIPANTLKAGVNEIRLTAPGDTRAAADIVLLRSIDVTYTRRLVAQDDALAFQADAGSYRVEGFTSDAIELYDITDPFDPARATNTTIAGRALTFGANAPRRWLAIGPNARKAVARIAPMSAANLRASDRQADYVIITHPDFVNALQPLVKYRGEHGLKVAVVTIGDVYDEFANGDETPRALRDFLSWTQTNWAKPAPRYALLVGKASYDYRDYLNGPNKNLVPTFLIETPNLTQAASDNWFVTADDKTGAPTLAIGRIPAKTPDQVARVVEKTIAYETGKPAEWRQRALYVADDKEVSFTEMADELAAKLPREWKPLKIYLADRKGDLKSARADILARWNEGAWMVTYIGHGSIDTWAAGPLFSAENVKEIKNGERLPILVTPTCLDGFFYHPQKDSLTEDLLFKSDGGIVAGLVPTGLSFPEPQRELMRGLYAELYEKFAPTLGDALMRAKQKMRGDAPDMREVMETFVLLGDPALRVLGR